MKTVLITGASSGMGKESAATLAREGYTVFAAARRVDRMEDLKSLGVRPVRMDITNDEDVVAALQRVTGETGRIDILVNNAGFGLYGPVEDVSVEDARYQFEVNLFGLARLTQLVLPHMRQQGSGTIVNISSMGGRIYTPFGAWYHATKHALEGWSDCLRFEVAPFGIDVVIIEPGLIASEFAEVVARPLREANEGSAYARMLQAVAEGTQERYSRPGAASPPSVIARVISRALRARRPRTRYVAGKMARPLMFMRRWLSDRMFDRILASQL